MTKEQIENGKIICCEFMGLKPTPSHGGGWGWSDTPYFSTQNNPDYDVALEHIVKYAKYDSDWNWLMGVVEKIAEIISKSDGVLYMENYIELETLLPFADIELAFNACVRFINSYNDNSSK